MFLTEQIVRLETKGASVILVEGDEKALRYAISSVIFIELVANMGIHV